MQILLLRHGKTEGNLSHKYIGRTDQSLCREGIAELRRQGIIGNIDTVYVSPLRRTAETAAILFPQAKPVVIEAFREMDFGDFEGRSPDEMADDPLYRGWVDTQCLDACPNGESMEEYSRIVCAQFEKLVADALFHGKDRLAIVAHGGTIMAIMGRYSRDNAPFYQWCPKNGSGWQANLDTHYWQQNKKFFSFEPFSRK